MRFLPEWFLGSDQIFPEVCRTVKSLSILRKNLTVDPYQLYEVRLLGADKRKLLAQMRELTR